MPLADIMLSMIEQHDASRAAADAQPEARSTRRANARTVRVLMDDAIMMRDEFRSHAAAR